MTQQESLSNIVQTKLNRPQITAQLIERSRLYTVLDRHSPLTIVVAPAGYGKTTLLSRWAEQCPLPCAWLSLDARDNRIGTFVDYVLAAVARLYPAVARQLAIGLTHSAATSYLAVARKLADELDAVNESFVIILDDYQFADDPAIHRFVAELLRFPARGLALVLASRVDPPLPLAMMRARGELSELRIDELRFTLAEVSAYLAGELNQRVDAAALHHIQDSTEGWIAGLHLTALYLQGQTEPENALTELAGASRKSTEYLADEVLGQQEPAVQIFLMKTAILERMCPALCDAVLGADPAAPESRRILDYLDGENLFTAPLDDSRLWFRYHHLFQQLLLARLYASFSTQEIAALYAAASHWCAAQDLRDEAIGYAVAAGDIDAAVALIESVRHAEMNAEHWQQLERWLNLLPQSQINANPQLVMLEAWLLHKRQRLSAVSASLDLAEALIATSHLDAEERRRLTGEMDTLRSQQYFNQGDALRTLAAAEQGLAALPPAYSSVRGLAWVFVGGSMLVMHGLPHALAALEDASRHSAALNSERARVLIIKCFLYWIAAERWSLETTAAELLRYAERHELPESALWAHYFSGCAAYQQSNLATAYEHFTVIMQRRHLAAGFVLIQGAFGLALVSQALGHADAAYAAVETVFEYAMETDSRSTRRLAQLFEAYLAVLNGRPEAAAKCISTGNPSFRSIPIVTLFAPPLATVTILLRQHTSTSLEAAAKMLEQMADYFSGAHLTFLQIGTCVLQAQLFLLRGQRPEAATALFQAVSLAQPGDVRRPFLEAGPGVIDLLSELNVDGECRQFVRRICADVQADVRPQQAGASSTNVPLLSAPPALPPALPPAPVSQTSPLFAQPRHPDLLELLTNRELEVLQLLALRMTNKEIAQALGITTGTVKQHTINVFRKLHVDNRREAIVQARAMGFYLETPYPT